MQEMDMQHALKAYVRDGEPAMGLTADVVLAAGRRSRRTRRLAGVAGAAVAVALAGTGVAAFTGGGSPDADLAAAACASPPGSRPPGVIAADRPLPPEVVEWAATSVTCHLGAELPRLLPNATYARVPGAPAGPLVGFSLGGEPPWGNRVDAMALVRDAAGTGDLSVSVGVVDPAEAAARAEDDCRRDTAANCTTRTGAEGETVVVSAEADGTPAGTPRTVTVRVYRGHTEVVVQVSNTDRRAEDGNAPRATRPEPVLSTEQAVALAKAPELFLFP